MKQLIKYFTPKQKLNIFDTRRTNSIIIISFLGLIIVLINALMNIIFPSDNSLVSIISSGILATVLISTLLILKYTNIRTTGNFFSIALIIGLALSLITLREDISALYKYVQGFYTILGVFSIGVLFAERRVIFINALIILLATTRVYSFAIEQKCRAS